MMIYTVQTYREHYIQGLQEFVDFLKNTSAELPSSAIYALDFDRHIGDRQEQLGGGFTRHENDKYYEVRRNFTVDGSIYYEIFHDDIGI